MVGYEEMVENGASNEVIDPHCLAEKPIKIKFQDITSAAFMIKSGIEYTPCTVNKDLIQIYLCVTGEFTFFY